MNIKFLGGIDKRPYATAAENIENMRYDEQRMCWKNDRSYRSWYDPDVDTAPAGEPSTGTIYSIYSYQRHKSSTQCLLFEELSGSAQSLTLKVTIGPNTYTLAEGRAVPRGNDPGTSYIKIGKFLFIINGEDPPLLYQGGRRIRTAFFHNRPTPPTPVETPGYWDQDLGTQTNGDLDYRKRFGKAGINFFDAAGNLGMALSPETISFMHTDATFKEFPLETNNSYQYAFSFISDTGAESPISPLSAQVAWKYKATGETRNLNRAEYKHGISVDFIPLGPPGTAKRRLYRTKNQRGGIQQASGPIISTQIKNEIDFGAGDDLFFLTDLNDNTSTVYFDLMPDSSLGSLAPSVSDSSPLQPGLTYGAAFKNHLILAGSSQNSSILYYSKGNFPEQFPAFNFFDLGSTEGGAITGLYATENVCYIFRERAIDVLVPTANLDLPFKIEPLVGGVGSLSPHSIQAVPGVGLVFLGHDKRFYALSGASNDSRYAGQAGVVPLGASINELTDKISANSLGRVVAVYSDRDKEYWAHCPVNGGRFATEGFVYHTAIKSWSRRVNIPAGCFSYLPERWVCFGSNAALTNLPVIEGVDESSKNGGIQTWCGALGIGYKTDGSGQNRERTTGSPDYLWESNWLDFADQNIIKRVIGITLFTYKNVGGGGSMRVGVDWKPLDYNTETSALDTTFKTYNSEQTTAGIIGTAKTDQGFTAKVTTIDSNRYSAREITGTRISNPFGSLQLVDGPGVTSMGEVGSGGARWWKIRFSGSQPVAFVGFEISFETPAGVKQLAFAAGNSDTNHSAMKTILGLS
tara:strand:- start:3210 stop:5621 length:2412 start_codon:yes stop_codon:yes gene_type:complete